MGGNAAKSFMLVMTLMKMLW